MKSNKNGNTQQNMHHKIKHQYIYNEDKSQTISKSAVQQNYPQHSFCQQHAENLSRFTQILAQRRFWYILPKGENDTTKATAIFDRKMSLLIPASKAQEMLMFIQQNPFSYLASSANSQTLATFHSATKLLWNKDTSEKQYSLQESLSIIQQGCWADIDGWALPRLQQFKEFATAANNPHRTENINRLKNVNGTDTYSWLTSEGRTDTDHWDLRSDIKGCIFSQNPVWQNISLIQILFELVKYGYFLLSKNNTKFVPLIDKRWQELSDDKLLLIMQQEDVELCSIEDAEHNQVIQLRPQQMNALFELINGDYSPCRLPKLDQSQLCDPNKGLWELWGEPKNLLFKQGLIARDPIKDIQRRAVAIDFGTSSTVVAMDTIHGSRELLRIGVRDFRTSPQPQHFENPTVLECLDLAAFTAAWTERAYRPKLDWNTMRAAHEAQTSFRDNPGDTKVLASILPKLKQWALRSDKNSIRLTDYKGKEIEIPVHTEYNPVRGQQLAITENYPFDPIELYAWYLGMAINWRERGIFLNYYLSFPVKYPREVKDRILASFRRGLQRSLPQSLIEHHPHILHDFTVEDLASEPAAYAAAAMAHLQLEPTDAGVPYAVFDFGGGTTDFDYGLLRWAKDKEELQGYEQVFEHLASEGDPYLGGENLLEHLVYASFQHNLSVLREARIQITKPIDAKPFVGSEAFIAPTQAAQTNTIMLAAKLRPFLESSDNKLDTQIKLDLIDAEGKKKTCELALDAMALDLLLASRIRAGVEAFFHELARLRAELPTESPIHVLLAGNGCRSRHIKALFNTESEAWLELLTQAFGDNPPEILVHPPLPMDEANPHAPTAKTGVALGLLRLVPGENTLLLDHVKQRHDGQAPFAWFVGRLRRRQFDAVQTPGASYQQWHEVGPLQQGVFNLYVSASPRAHKGLPEGDPELQKHRLDFAAAPVDARLFVRATGPNTIELAAALDQSSVDDSTVKTLKLA